MIEYDNRYWNNNLTTNNNTGMDFTGLGTAIGGIAGAIGTTIASNNNLKGQRETNAMNLQLAREQNDWNLMMYNKNNEYNSPQAKLQRLAEAGLNPLYFGLDGQNATAPQSANLANQVAPQVDAGAIGNAFGNLTTSLFNAAQLSNIRKELTLKNKELDIRAAELAARTPGYQASANQSNAAANLLEKQAVNEEKRGKVIDQEYDNLVKDGAIKDAQAVVLQETQKQLMTQTDLIREKITTEKTTQLLNDALRGKANAETKTINATRDEQVRKLAAEAALSENEAKKVIEEIGLVIAQKDKTKADKEMTELMIKYEKRYGDAERVAKIFTIATQGIENVVDSVIKVAGAVVTGGASGAAQSAAEGFGKGFNGKPSSQSSYHPYHSSVNSPVNTAVNPGYEWNGF